MNMMAIDRDVPTKFLRDYYKSNSSICLNCGDDNLKSTLPRTNEEGDLVVKVQCEDCKAAWEEKYTMSSIKMIPGY